jgi:hypothetical protein
MTRDDYEDLQKQQGHEHRQQGHAPEKPQRPLEEGGAGGGAPQEGGGGGGGGKPDKPGG